MEEISSAHRPWPPPPGPWAMVQVWHDLLFAHWPVPPDAVRGHLPAGLALDTLDGQAWVGVVPFTMSGIRLRGLPPVPGATAFPEINVRTYVTAGDKPGVFFFSLDAASPLAVAVARTWFRLPYYYARMEARAEGDAVCYTSRRSHRGATPAEFSARYRPAGAPQPARPGTIEQWLTERYCLYTPGRGERLQRGEILHAPWSLQPAEAEIETNTMARAHGLPLPAIRPLLHFSRRLSVVLWALRPA